MLCYLPVKIAPVLGLPGCVFSASKEEKCSPKKSHLFLQCFAQGLVNEFAEEVVKPAEDKKNTRRNHNNYGSVSVTQK